MSSSTFCNNCKAVIFDDSREEGYDIARGEDGLEFLQVRCDDRDTRRILAVDYDVEDSYPDLPFLAASAAAGCELCSFLRAMALGPELKAAWSEDAWSESPWSEDGEYEWGEARLHIQMWYVWQANNPLPREIKGLRGLEICFHFQNDYAMDYKAFLSFSIESPPGPCAKWLGINTKEPGYVLSPSALAWIHEKLDIEPCKSSAKSPPHDAFVPTRLIRVDCEPPRLIETPHTTGNPAFNYAALSYCWGSPEQAMSQLKTERSSLGARLSAIREHEMTSVLQDAIETCRALKITFLWVDALCIIQDDVLDWQRESALMGKVYSNAHLTICPLSSESCTQGFLCREPAQFEISFRSKVKPEIFGSYSLRFYGVRPSDYNDYNWLRAEFYGSKWEKRGWTFQEMTMSRRLLAFGGSNVHFINPDQWGTLNEVFVDGEFMFQVAQLDNEMGYTQEEDYYRIWHMDVASAFSKRSLTYRKDRFPALSGIAQYFTDILSDEYVAGLWKKELYKGLFWVCMRKNNKSWNALLDELSNASEYLAPSWSWASRDDYVEFGTRHYQVYSSVEYDDYRREYSSLETNVEPKGIDAFGQLQAGSLQITTRIRPLPTDLRVPGDEWNDLLVGDPAMPPLARCNLDWQPGIEGEPRREVMMLLLGSAGTVESPSSDSIVSSASSLRSDAADGTASITGLAEEDDCRWVYGLLIHPVGIDTNTFLRVGTFYSTASDGWGASIFRDIPETTVTLV